MKKANSILIVVVAFLLGALASTTIRPVHADGADEIHRSREALESIARSLERCPR